MDLEDRLNVACGLARMAGSVALEYFRSPRLSARDKGVRDVVTAADFESEALLRNGLQNAFPEDGVVGEEGTSIPSRSGRRWLLDPVDGTLNFSRGLPIWCVSVACFDDEGPLLGAIYDPVRDELFSGARDHGASMNGAPIRCSGLETPEQALVHLTVDFHDDSRDRGIEDLRLLAPRVMRTRNIGSAALALAYVAAGYFDAMLHRSASAWDYGAGVLLIREAGGSVSDMDGNPYHESARALAAASTESLRTSLLAIVGNDARALRP